MGEIYLRNDGYCHCCTSNTTFESTSAWLRDNYLCVNCKSIPRQRHLHYVLDSFFPRWQRMAVHESSPNNKFISRQCPGYTFSHLLPDVKPGDSQDGVRCENLEQLTFGDAAFDFFITQDVFEHIYNPMRAAREIRRVLKPGGSHIFTTPKHRGLDKSRPRALRDNGTIEHVLKEEYHGNPVGDGRSLVTWDYGDDFELLMSTWADGPMTTYLTRDRKLGLDGEYLQVFVVRKPF